MRTAEGTLVDGALLSRLIDEACREISDGSAPNRACGILEDLVLRDTFADFLTLGAYRLLD